MGLRFAILVFAAGIGCTRGPAAGAAQSKPRTCSLDGIPGEVLCAAYPVWENRDRQAGRRITLNIVILPALTSPVEHDPLVILAGGPGQAATDLIQAFFRNRDLRAHRQVVFIDQRGSGVSNPLNCDLYGSTPDPKRILAGPFPIDSVRACRQHLQSIADLGQYTTAASMDDVDDVRRWLGYEKVNLWGGSYGTRAAQVYLRRHGDHVRAVVLDGVLPVDELVPLHQPATAQRAIDLFLARNRTAFPNLEREFHSLFDPAKPLSLGLLEGIRHAMYGGDPRAFPDLIHRAAAGDPGPLQQRAIDAEIALSRLSIGLNLSITCAEDIPFLDDGAIARETAGTFLGDARIQRQRAACREWVAGAVPPDLHEPVRSEVPVLLFSGGRDPVTPPAFADHVAASLPNSRHIVFPDSAHGNFSPCARQLLSDFIAAASPRTLNAACVPTQ
ncbi:MAG TPA: alpha/beta hydrolase [Candidatus Solibacter sp.]|jgi:pimeloyl-ACP methyl ester carboxylesterase